MSLTGTNDGFLNRRAGKARMSAANERPAPIPLAFVIVSFAAAIAIGAAIAYLGITGRIGAGIP